MIGIYKFTNKINDKVYIGQSIHLNYKYQQHEQEYLSSRKNSKFYQALRQYGWENFEYEILEECSAEALNEREIFWISYYNSFEDGYNSTPGGQSALYNPQTIYDAWDKGLSVGEISKSLNIGSTTVLNNLKEYENYSTFESKKRGGKKHLKPFVLIILVFLIKNLKI